MVYRGTKPRIGPIIVGTLFVAVSLYCDTIVSTVEPIDWLAMSTCLISIILFTLGSSMIIVGMIEYWG